MKCHACGYEKRVMWITDNKFTRYKSGKNKGDVKDISEGRRDIFEDDPEFKEITIGEGAMDFKEKKDGFMKYEYVTVYACPNCGTLKIDV
mgnify:CR=1 FL=1